MKGRLKRLEKELVQNKDLRVIIARYDFDEEDERFYYWLGSKKFGTEDELKEYLNELAERENFEYHLIISLYQSTPYSAIESWYEQGLDEETIKRWIDIHYPEMWADRYSFEEVEETWARIRERYGG